MTSNIGARQLKDFGTGVGFSTSAQKNQSEEIEKGVIQSALKKTFAPEFLNRVDDIVIFNALEKEDLLKIVDIELKKLDQRITKLGYTLSLSKKAKEFIGEKGYDKQYGARPLSRALQRYVEDIIAEEIVSNNLKEGDNIKLDWDGKAEKLQLDLKNA
jgi:ATP-dependent Clp protease ATP-binding subunit ClpC